MGTGHEYTSSWPLRSVAGSGPATELRNAQDPLDSGATTPAEYDSIKTKALASA
jgi:hypothetical protein